MIQSLYVNDPNGEFLLNGQKLYFLENLNRLNLFIGANNSRKSRLLRKIIEADARILVTSDIALNQRYIDSLALAREIEQVKGNDTGETLLEFKGYDSPIEEGERFYGIKEYFDGRNQSQKMFSFRNLIDHINNINETLRALRTDENITTLLAEIKSARLIADLMHHLYEIRKVLVDMQHFTINNDWEEFSLRKIKFKFTDGERDYDKSVERDFFYRAKTYFDYLANIRVELGTNRLVYIPVLRTSRGLLGANSKIYDDIFKLTIHRQYFNDKLPYKGDQIFTGLHFYNAIQKEKNGSSKQQKNFLEFEKFIGKSFFRSENLRITAYHDPTGQNHEIRVDLPGERTDTPIHDLGDGVQAIINLFFPVFSADDNTWIFIDEPELNLHPGFQNLFIRTLLENEFLKKKNLRFFINSHSNHILSEVLLNGPDGVETYVLKPKNESCSEIMPFKGAESATLELLGVLNTSTLISNCSIWVEGITDRLYFRAFLTAYLTKDKLFQPIEGLNYTFIEYGGNNLVHYLFDDSSVPAAIDEGIRAYYVNNKIFLIGDTDLNKDNKHQFYKGLERAKTFIYRETQYPEIENILPPAVLSKFLQDKFEIEKTISDDITGRSYAKVKLGKFLTAQFARHQIKRKVEASTGGTLTTGYKNMLASWLVAGVKDKSITWDMLAVNEVVKNITVGLYDFISLHNEKLFNE